MCGGDRGRAPRGTSSGRAKAKVVCPNSPYIPYRDESFGASRVLLSLVMLSMKRSVVVHQVFRPSQTFGEFYHQFPSDLTDQDRVLLAGFFCQRTNTDTSFTTSAANELLREHGVRPANPSQSIRRLRDARRLFPVANGAFRVSEAGVRYLEELRARNVEG